MKPIEREQFLAETRVGVLSITEEGLGPFTVPLWYSYERSGNVRFVTDGSSKKGQLLRRAGRASLCVQVDAPPYRYVSVEGPVDIVGSLDVERDGTFPRIAGRAGREEIREAA